MQVVGNQRPGGKVLGNAPGPLVVVGERTPEIRLQFAGDQRVAFEMILVIIQNSGSDKSGFSHVNNLFF
jgi:hypothetical protein